MARLQHSQQEIDRNLAVAMLATSNGPHNARDFQRSSDLSAKMTFLGAILPVDHCILRWNVVDKGIRGLIHDCPSIT